MLSRQIVLSDLSLRTRPILETILGLGIGFKLRRQRSSVFQCRTDDGILTLIKLKNKLYLITISFNRFTALL